MSKKFIKILKFFLPTLIFLLLLEVFVRFLDLPPYAHSNNRNMYVQVEKEGFDLNPGYGGKMSSLEYSTDVFVDNNSLRVSNPSQTSNTLEKDSSKKRILFVGDSLTFGEGVNQSETFSGRFENSEQFEALNAGVPSYGTIQTLQKLKKIGPNINPDIVVYTFYPGNDFFDNYRGNVKFVVDGYLTEDFPPEFSINDIVKNLYDRGVIETSESTDSALLEQIKSKTRIFDIKKVPYDQIVDTKAYSEIKNFGLLDRMLLKTSKLYRYMRYKAMFVGAFRGLYESNGIYSLEKCALPYSMNVFMVGFPANAEEQKEVEITKSAILEMKNYAEQELGAKFVFTIMPVKEQINPKIKNYEVKSGCFDANSVDFETPTRLIFDFAYKNNIEIIELAPSLKNSLQNGKNPYFDIDSHINKHGHKAVFETLKEKLKSY